MGMQQLLSIYNYLQLNIMRIVAAVLLLPQ
jgi:hypothetical protein